MNLKHFDRTCHGQRKSPTTADNIKSINLLNPSRADDIVCKRGIHLAFTPWTQLSLRVQNRLETLLFHGILASQTPFIRLLTNKKSFKNVVLFGY